jgi:hypothetical protein
MSLKESLAQSKGRYGFIPISKLRELVTHIAVQSHLESQGVKISKALKPTTVVRSRKLFAILILLALERHIENLLDNGITDNIFPAYESDLSILEDDEDRHSFLVEQWTIPFPFHPEQNMNIPRNAILPFLSKERINYGTFGIVYKVRVADGHLVNYQVG